ncbi:hypothetical protein Y032_0015g2518 [Ancylostoma ceylanicum]|uniref:Uncharacterized protein n=1 Tax=Ancylostoma ceylanicum TaxID=53326 RepID=A0A016V8Z9_9BILA|nr:hypothetical protein Y032_0015g2518 [Ancylostoma ceylanicum]
MLEIATYPEPSRNDNPSKEPGGGSLKAVLATRHGCNVGKRVFACPIDKINGSTRQFGVFPNFASMATTSGCSGDRYDRRRSPHG